MLDKLVKLCKNKVMKKDIKSEKVFKLISEIKYKSHYFEYGNEKAIEKAINELDGMMVDLLTGYQMYVEMQKDRQAQSESGGSGGDGRYSPVVTHTKLIKSHE